MYFSSMDEENVALHSKGIIQKHDRGPKKGMGMKFGDNKEFDLSKKYEFRVSVNGEVGCFSAELKLSPEAITLRISGDQVGLRRWGHTRWELESLECFGLGWNFVLFDLHCVRSGSFSVGEMLGTVMHFEAEYVAGYAVISSAGDPSLDMRSIHLLSPSLEKWVGYTEKQQEIIDNQVSGSRVGLISDFEGFDTTEFCISVKGEAEIVVNYNIIAKASPFEFEVGVRFPPSFCVFSESQILPRDVMQLYQKTYAFLSLLHGHELQIDRIELCGDDPRSGNTYLYYPKPTLSAYELSSYSWFPLGHNLRFDSLGLLSFPFESISKYFSKEYAASDKWSKYLKYRRMKNVEERFLGYFRLLESLTKTTKSFLDPDLLKVQVTRVESIMVRIFGQRKEVKGFLRGIERYNNSKYNTEKCILDFYKKLPEEVLNGWFLKQDAITSICKLRNDISHANDYFENNDDLLSKCAFIESLLIIALLETVDVPVSTTAKLIGRMPGSHHLTAV